MNDPLDFFSDERDPDIEQWFASGFRAPIASASPQANVESLDFFSDDLDSGVQQPSIQPQIVQQAIQPQQDTSGMSPEQLRTYELKRAGIATDYRSGPLGYVASKVHEMGASMLQGVVDLGQSMGFFTDEVWQNFEAELQKPIAEHQIQSQVNIERAMESHGVLGRGLTIAAQTAADTALFLGLMKFGMRPLGGIKMLPAGVKAGATASKAAGMLAVGNSVEAAKLAAFRFITTPGDLEEKGKSAGLAFAYRATPALSGFAPSLLKAKLYDIALNSGVSITSKQYNQAWEQGKIEAMNAGDKNWLAYSLTNLIPILGTDVFFSLSTRNLATEMARANARGGVEGLTPKMSGFEAANVAAKFFDDRAEKGLPVPAGYDKMSESALIENYVKTMRTQVPAEREKAAADKVKAEADEAAGREAEIDGIARAVAGGVVDAERGAKMAEDAGWARDDLEERVGRVYRELQGLPPVETKPSTETTRDIEPSVPYEQQRAEQLEGIAQRLAGGIVGDAEAERLAAEYGWDRTQLMARVGEIMRGEVAAAQPVIAQLRPSAAPSAESVATPPPTPDVAKAPPATETPAPAGAAPVAVREELAPKPPVEPEGARAGTEAKPPERMTPDAVEIWHVGEGHLGNQVRVAVNKKTGRIVAAVGKLEENAAYGTHGLDYYIGKKPADVSAKKMSYKTDITGWNTLDGEVVREGDRYVFNGEATPAATLPAKPTKQQIIEQDAEAKTKAAVDFFVKNEETQEVKTVGEAWNKLSEIYGVGKLPREKNKSVKAGFVDMMRDMGYMIPDRGRVKGGTDAWLNLPLPKRTVSSAKAGDIAAEITAKGKEPLVTKVTPADLVAEAEARGEKTAVPPPVEDTGKKSPPSPDVVLEQKQLYQDTLKEYLEERSGLMKKKESGRGWSITDSRRLKELNESLIPTIKAKLVKLTPEEPTPLAPLTERLNKEKTPLLPEAPKDATFVRMTDAQGRSMTEPISAVKKANPFVGANPVKIEFVTKNTRGEFRPMGEQRFQTGTLGSTIEAQDKAIQDAARAAGLQLTRVATQDRTGVIYTTKLPGGTRIEWVREKMPEGKAAAAQEREPGVFRISIDPDTGRVTSPAHELTEVVGIMAGRGLQGLYGKQLEKALGFDLRSAEGWHKLATEAETQAGRDAIVERLKGAGYTAQEGFRGFVNRLIRIWNSLTGMDVKELLDKDWQKFSEGFRNLSVIQDIVRMDAEGRLYRERGMRGQVTPEQDREYMAAVERGDAETAQRMVDEAAKKAGYAVGPVYHGTARGAEDAGETSGGILPFSIFKPSKIGVFGPQIYLTKKEDEARSWAKVAVGERGRRGQAATPTIIRAFVKSPNPINTNKQGPAFFEKFGGIDDAQSVKKMQDAGYTGVVADDYVVVPDPSQIKSADAITRDDKGRVIPLSERFNPKSPDIRYQSAIPKTPDTWQEARKNSKTWDEYTKWRGTQSGPMAQVGKASYDAWKEARYEGIGPKEPEHRAAAKIVPEAIKERADENRRRGKVPSRGPIRSWIQGATDSFLSVSTKLQTSLGKKAHDAWNSSAVKARRQYTDVLNKHRETVDSGRSNEAKMLYDEARPYAVETFGKLGERTVDSAIRAYNLARHMAVSEAVSAFDRGGSIGLKTWLDAKMKEKGWKHLRNDLLPFLRTGKKDELSVDAEKTLFTDSDDMSSIKMSIRDLANLNLTASQKKLADFYAREYQRWGADYARKRKELTGEDVELDAFYIPKERDYQRVSGDLMPAIEAANKSRPFKSRQLASNVDLGALGIAQKREYTAIPLMLRGELENLNNHVNDIARYVGLAEFFDTWKSIFRNQNIVGDLRDAIGQTSIDSLNAKLDQIEGIIYSDTAKPWEKLGSTILGRTTSAALMGPAIVLYQPISAMQYGLAHGWGNMVKAIGQMATADGRELARTLIENAPIIKHRADEIRVEPGLTSSRAKEQAIYYTRGVGSKTARMAGLLEQTQRGGLWGLQKADELSQAIGLLTVYNKYKSQGKEIDMAKIAAEAEGTMIDTQSSADPMDMSGLRMSKSGIVRLLSLLSGEASAIFNTITRNTSEAVDVANAYRAGKATPEQVRAAFRNTAATLFTVAMMQAWVASIKAGRDKLVSDDGEEEDWVKKAKWRFLEGMTGLLPFPSVAGPFSNQVVARLLKDTQRVGKYDWQTQTFSSFATKLPESVLRMVRSADQYYRASTRMSGDKKLSAREAARFAEYAKKNALEGGRGAAEVLTGLSIQQHMAILNALYKKAIK